MAHSVFYRVGAALDDVGMDVHVWDMIGFHRNFDKVGTDFLLLVFMLVFSSDARPLKSTLLVNKQCIRLVAAFDAGSDSRYHY